jgi:hypothetical protein
VTLDAQYLEPVIGDITMRVIVDVIYMVAPLAATITPVAVPDKDTLSLSQPLRVCSVVVPGLLPFAIPGVLART